MRPKCLFSPQKHARRLVAEVDDLVASIQPTIAPNRCEIG
jgi:hypothetical protein